MILYIPNNLGFQQGIPQFFQLNGLHTIFLNLLIPKRTIVLYFCDISKAFDKRSASALDFKTI